MENKEFETRIAEAKANIIETYTRETKKMKEEYNKKRALKKVKDLYIVR